MGWQPIETAPRNDFERLILYDLDIGVCTGFWCEGEDEFPPCWETSDGVSSFYDAEVSHWMPLPQPPAMDADNDA
tara:strand:+ start:1545 stop:1769 length:225 start_codon:yes stop_codon:yes gene_type:complete